MLKTMAKSHICQGKPPGVPRLRRLCLPGVAAMLKIVIGAPNLFTIDS